MNYEKLSHFTNPVLYGTFPAPSNDVTAAPVLQDVVAEAEASAVGEFEVSVACTSACFGPCRDGDFQAPKGKILKSLVNLREKIEIRSFPKLKSNSDIQ